MADEPDDTEADLLRDRLLMQAERGEITGAQAEEAAAAHGLEPFENKPELPRFDPKLKSHWSIVMAVAWIAWRDFEMVREQDPEFCSACFHWIARRRKVRPHNDGGIRQAPGIFSGGAPRADSQSPGATGSNFTNSRQCSFKRRHDDPGSSGRAVACVVGG